ncbi:Glyoxalase/Bleomycin resistance protein/Dihydroxybiphenyl dioxygenase [Lipomyces chichibuensis]|uniref:Glyoxalase/Bleomycin resistance protein/Dihydroxybiphenyl dioxygenase n=1 Tax=Lipomyces chichibuensis TaxID=1546026 RepID=UPI0033432C14
MNSASKVIYLNVPVVSASASSAFYSAVGFTQNHTFSDATSACMTISPTFNVMLLEHGKFELFAPKSKTIADGKSSAQMLICISMDSRDEVDAMVENAEKAGGKKDTSPSQDRGMMYSRNFEDLDGHVWEVMWMDPNFAPHEAPDAKSED